MMNKNKIFDLDLNNKSVKIYWLKKWRKNDSEITELKKNLLEINKNELNEEFDKFILLEETNFCEIHKGENWNLKKIHNNKIYRFDKVLFNWKEFFVDYDEERNEWFLCSNYTFYALRTIWKFDLVPSILLRNIFFNDEECEVELSWELKVIWNYVID